MRKEEKEEEKRMEQPPIPSYYRPSSTQQKRHLKVRTTSQTANLELETHKTIPIED